MSHIGRTVSDLIETVYQRSGVNAPTRLGLIEDACQQFEGTSVNEPRGRHTAETIKGLAALACRPSLEVVSRGLRHNREVAEEVFLRLGIVANLIEGVDITDRYVKGAVRELAVMGALWGGLAHDERRQPGHARFTSHIEDNSDGNGPLLSGFDIVLTTPSKTRRVPQRTKLQIKAELPRVHVDKQGRTRKKVYEDDIVIVPVDQLGGEQRLVSGLAELDLAHMSEASAAIEGIIRNHRALAVGRGGLLRSRRAQLDPFSSHTAA